MFEQHVDGLLGPDWPKWLEDIAIRVDELAAGSARMEHFREMVRAWVSEHRDQQSKAQYPDYPALILPKRAMTLPHCYATLAAIHDEICEGMEPINPWETLEHESDPDPEETKQGIAYAVLRSRVAELGDDDRERIETALQRAGADLADPSDDLKNRAHSQANGGKPIRHVHSGTVRHQHTGEWSVEHVHDGEVVVEHTGQVDVGAAQVGEALEGLSEAFVQSGKSETTEAADDQNQAGTDDGGKQSESKDKSLAPSRQRAKAAYEWAMQNIEGAEDMPYSQLFDAIDGHPEYGGEGLPSNAETFGKYLRDAGVKRNATNVSRTPTGSIIRNDQI